MGNLLFLDAPLLSKIWGGDYFHNVLKVSDKDDIGEMWVASGYKGVESRILNGKYKGLTLRDVYLNHPELFNNPTHKEFPILIKIIAANDDLSIQVHPDDIKAKELENGVGKTEGWLILSHKIDAKLVVGHNIKNKEEFQKRVDDDKYDGAFKEIKVEDGEFYPIPAGTIHAIGKGIVLLEIQQSSDITYRVFDYHRKDKNGNERELHTAKAIEVTNYGPYNQKIHNVFKENIDTIWDNQYFKVRLVKVNDNYNLINDKDYLIVTSLSNDIKVDDRKLNIGSSFIVCHDLKEVSLKGKGNIIIVESKR